MYYPLRGVRPRFFCLQYSEQHVTANRTAGLKSQLVVRFPLFFIEELIAGGLLREIAVPSGVAKGVESHSFQPVWLHDDERARQHGLTIAVGIDNLRPEQWGKFTPFL